ncbi:MAG: glycosyltransferase family 39 protein [Anaerolineaceae bacterium]|nr:glycosyltransferase family 39 protein [Anaerolineaceae bacterium]
MKINHRLPFTAWATFFAAALASGIYFLWVLIRLPSDSAGGYSFQRLAILSIFSLLVLTQAILLGLICWLPTLRNRWLALAQNSRFWCIGLVLSISIILFSQVLLDWLKTAYQNNGTFSFLAYVIRLSPVLHWLTITGVLFSGVILLVYNKSITGQIEEQTNNSLRSFLWIWLILALGCLAVVVSGLDVQPDTVGSWGSPGVPLLEWQIAFAALLSLFFSWILLRYLHGKRTDFWICLIIWVLAAVLWAGHPLIPGYFATPGRPPNNEIYPFSDGATYDQYAQSILVGGGFLGDSIPQRPLYLVFLAGLHLLAGQNYLRVIFLQTLVLALFPVFLYLIGRELHSRPAGFMAALLVIFRELTAIQSAPFTDNISYSKLYFSELPTALCLAAFIWFFLRWVKNPRRWSSAAASGGLLGMAMLIRTQSFAVLPFVLLTGLLWMGIKKWKIWLWGVLLAGLGLIICLTPWYVRNWRIAGGLALDNPASQTMVLAQRYNQIPFDSVIPQLAGESTSQYSARLTHMAVQGIIQHPGEAARAIAGHFVNNEMGSLLVFPIRFKLLNFNELIWPTAPFWESWSGKLTSAQALILLATLAIIAAGLASATKRFGALGLAPLFVNLAYNFSTAVFRSSGDRFLLPVDWVAILYYALGASQIAIWCLTLYRVKYSADKDLPEYSSRLNPDLSPASSYSQRWLVGLTCLVILIVGLSLPLSEVVFPVRYAAQPSASVVNQLAIRLKDINAASQNNVAVQFLNQPGITLISGRALYPRFYAKGENEPKTAKTGYAGLNFGRLVFSVVGSQNPLVVFPIDQSPPYFPNASDVLMAGCMQNHYFQPVVILVNQGTKPIYLASGPIPSVCTSIIDPTQ